MHVTLTSDVGKILTNLHTVRIDGEGHFSSGIQVAQLALKHRQNKNQKQRIVLFVGSPISEDEKALVRLGKKLKKNNGTTRVALFFFLVCAEIRMQWPWTSSTLAKSLKTQASWSRSLLPSTAATTVTS